jgi:hypothetical protein
MITLLDVWHAPGFDATRQHRGSMRRSSVEHLGCRDAGRMNPVFGRATPGRVKHG